MDVTDRTGSILVVEYRGALERVTIGLSFGRSADIVLDPANLHLHRETGRFRRRGAEWLLHNTGSRLHLQLHHSDGLHTELPPGTSIRVPAGRGAVRVEVGGDHYELSYRLDPTGQTTRVSGSATDTVPFGGDLTPAQIDYAVTLARHRLVGLRLPPPGQSEIASLWGVSPRTVAKTFEDIRVRLRAEGVERIETPDDLIEHLVSNRVITTEHLVAAGLDDPSGPHRRRDILRRFGTTPGPRYATDDG